MASSSVSTPATGHAGKGDLTGRALQALSRFGLLGVLVLLVAVFSLLKPETFADWPNLRNILTTQAPGVFLAFAATLPLILREFDLSIAAVFNFAQVLTVGLILNHGWAVPVAIVVVIGLTVVAGLINGIAVARFGINSFVATLATGSIVGGATLAFSKGESILGAPPHGFTGIARNSVAGIPLPVIYFLVAAALLTLILVRFPVGRRMYAVGANALAAERTGVSPERYVIPTFAASAALAGIGGVLIGSRLGAATGEGGIQLVIPAFASAFLGATAFWPGRFNVLGTLVAVYVIAVAVTGLQQLGVALWVEPVFEGAMLFVAVGLSAWTVRLRARRAKLARLRELERRALDLDPAADDLDLGDPSSPVSA